MIKVNNLSFAYDGTNILKDVNFNESEPVIIGLWGRNGSGKTTLMKILSGLETGARHCRSRRCYTL